MMVQTLLDCTCAICELDGKAVFVCARCRGMTCFDCCGSKFMKPFNKLTFRSGLSDFFLCSSCSKAQPVVERPQRASLIATDARLVAEAECDLGGSLHTWPNRKLTAEERCFLTFSRCSCLSSAFAEMLL